MPADRRRPGPPPGPRSGRVDDRGQAVGDDDQRPTRATVSIASRRATSLRASRLDVGSSSSRIGAPRAASGRSRGAAARRRTAGRRPRRPARPGPAGSADDLGQVDRVEELEHLRVGRVRARSGAGSPAACRPGPAPPARRSRAGRAAPAGAGRARRRRRPGPLPPVDVVEALDELQQRRLARAGGADEGGAGAVPGRRTTRPATTGSPGARVAERHRVEGDRDRACRSTAAVPACRLQRQRQDLLACAAARRGPSAAACTRAAPDRAA